MGLSPYFGSFAKSVTSISPPCLDGVTPDTFDVDIVDDPLNDLAETFTVRLANPEGSELGMQVSSVVMIASDVSDPEPSVAFARAEAEVREGEGRLDV